MNYKSICAVSFFGFFGIFASVANVAAAPEFEIPEVQIQSSDKSPPNGIMLSVFGPAALADNPLDIEVRANLDRALIEGTVEPITGSSEILFLFKPTEPIPVGSYYMSGTYQDFQVTAHTEVVTLENTTLASISFNANDVATQENCCVDAYEKDVCWGTAFEKAVGASVDFGEPAEYSVTTINRAVLTLDGEEIASSVSGVKNRDLLLNTAASPSGEVCVKTTIESFDGTMLDEQENCESVANIGGLDEASSPALLDDPSAGRCDMPPEDEEDPNWLRHMPRNESNGCSTTSGGSNFLLVLALGLVFGFSRRRKS